MKKIISTKVHGMIDYGTALGMIALPRIFKMDPFVTRLLTGSAILTTIYSLFTKYELGLFKVLPMKAHLGLDAAQSAALAGAPLAFAQSKRTALPVLLGISLLEGLVTLSSHTRKKRKFLGFRF